MDAEDNSGQTTLIFQRIEVIFNLINQFIIAFLAIYMTWLCIYAGFKYSSLHAWLCTIAYQLLMAEAILTMYENNTFTSSYSRRTKNLIHLVMQAVGGVLGIGGMAYEIYHKSKHFNTIHGILGLCSLVFLCINLISGIVTFYAADLRNIIKPLTNKAFHNFIGILTFVLGMWSLYYGYDKRFVQRIVHSSFVDILRAFTVIIAIFTLIGPLKSLYRQITTLFFNYSA